MLYVDVPTRQEIRALNHRRSDACVSIYLATTPLTQHVAISQTELGNLSKQAFGQLEDAGFDKGRLALMRERIEDLLDDDAFWRIQANSLSVFLTSEDIKTFRLANHLQNSVEVSDRFHLKPLLRAVTFPHTAFVLAISENAVRLIEVSSGDQPHQVTLAELPKSAADAVNKSSLNDRAPSGRIQGAEGQKVRLAQFARIVDAAIRPILAGLDVPLVLAASQPLASIYRSMNSYPGLLEQGLLRTDDRTSDGELAAAVVALLDQWHATSLDSIRRMFDERVGAGLASTDIAELARAAAFGAIDTLLVDIDAAVPGTIDRNSGALALAETSGPSSYDILDEIAGLAIASGARVLAVRSQDIPGGGPVAAILRYRV